MKPFIIVKLTIITLLAGLLAGCSEKLVEENNGILTPDYFKTAAGIQNGVIGALNYNRFYYGFEGCMVLNVTGTDEFTYGDTNTNPDINSYGAQLNSNNNIFQQPWNSAYQAINTCNGIIKNGKNVTGLNSAELAERMKQISIARFLRANWYYILTSMWGDVTLNLAFTEAPSSAATRTPVVTILDSAILDLRTAIPYLDNNPNWRGSYTRGVPGKAAALHLLAKMYLNKAWITKSATDFSAAAQCADSVINNANTYNVSLERDFANVHTPGNEEGREILFNVQWNVLDNYNERGATDQFGRALNKSNNSNFLFVMNYEGQSGMTRDIPNGRPWRRFKPTDYLLNTVFARNNRSTDSRYEKTFKTVWFCNNPNANFRLGDTTIFMPGFDTTITGRKYVTFYPSTYTSGIYPQMDKYKDIARAVANNPSTRPFIVYRFAETYLIAAEAYFKLGNSNAAMNRINEVRKRAAYRSTYNSAQLTTAISAIQITDPALVTIDLILDERSRELCGEQQRWFDLKRTEQLATRIQAGLNASTGRSAADNVAAKNNFRIDKHLVRPIPITQINSVTDGPAYPQNPNY